MMLSQQVLSRRDVLQGAAAAGAAVCLPGTGISLAASEESTPSATHTAGGTSLIFRSFAERPSNFVSV